MGNFYKKKYRGHFKKVILEIFIKIEYVFLVIYIGLNTSIYNFKAYSNYSFKFLNIEISIVIISIIIIS
jgi:uncharacterized membrane protein